MSTWQEYAQAGDDWFIGYAHAPARLPHVSLFLVGHAVELYLKATYVKLYRDEERAMKLSHNLKCIWDGCKTADKAFMAGREIRHSVFSVNFLHPKAFSTLSVADQVHYIENQGFYIIMKHLPDLKYFSLPWKKQLPGTKGIWAGPRDMYWIRFFKDLRAYLNFPNKGFADVVKITLRQDKDLSPAIVDYLGALYSP
jgi:hypothetical protein